MTTCCIALISCCTAGGGDFSRQKESAKFPLRKFPNGPGAAGLLGDYGGDFVTGGRLAPTGADGWTVDGHFYFRQKPDGLLHMMQFCTAKRQGGAIKDGDTDGDKDADTGGKEKSKGQKEREERDRHRQQQIKQLKGCAYCVLKQLGVKNSSCDPLVCRKAEFLTHIPDIKLISKTHALQCARGRHTQTGPAQDCRGGHRGLRLLPQGPEPQR
jgi:hypothetical protein